MGTLTKTMNLENAANWAIEEVKALIENEVISADEVKHEVSKFLEIVSNLLDAVVELTPFYVSGTLAEAIKNEAWKLDEKPLTI